MAAINITENQFREMMKEGTLFLADYWAPWCSYCRRIGPAYDQIAQQYQDRFPVVKINIDENSPLADLEQIEVIPTLVLYRDGKILGSVVAPGSKAAIDQFIQDTLAQRT